jgi:hypothetical protein
MARFFELLSEFSSADITVLCLTIMVGATFAGHLADWALGDNAFGVYGNALVFITASFATLAGYLIGTGSIQESDATRLSFYCTSLSLVALVSLGILRSRLTRA